MNIFTKSINESFKPKTKSIDDFEIDFKKQFYDSMVMARKDKIANQKDLIRKFSNKSSFVSSVLMQDLSIKEKLKKLFFSKSTMIQFKDFVADKICDKKVQIAYIKARLEDYPEYDMERYQLGNLKYDIPPLDKSFDSILDMYLDENYWTGKGDIKTINFSKFKDYETKEKLAKYYELKSKYFHRTDNLKPSEIIKISEDYDIEIAISMKEISTQYQSSLKYVRDTRSKVIDLFKELINKDKLDRDKIDRYNKIFRHFMEDAKFYTEILSNYNITSINFYIKYYKETANVIHKIFLDIDAFYSKRKKGSK